MANSFDALYPENWKDIIQDYLNKMLVGMDIANVKCEAYLKDGDQVNFPYVNDVRIQSYTPGTDLTIDDYTATQNSLIVNQSKAATVRIDPQEKKQAKANYGIQLARQSAYQLMNNMDQGLFSEMSSYAGNTIAAGTLSLSNIYTYLSQAKAQLTRNNATDDTLFAVLCPEAMALLEQNFVANGFNMADSVLKNGKVGQAAGFELYVSNNLPTTQTLTVATNPTAADTLTVAGVVFTFVANGTAAAAGDISIGANAAATQAIIKNAINGAGTPGASTYIEVSTEDRRTLQNAQIASATFSGNASVITGFGRIAGSDTFTAAADGYGTESSQILTGRMGAVSMAVQMKPELYIRPEPKQIGENYITHTLWGVKLFFRDKKRVVKVTHNL
jgi:hypothetical protein